MAWPAHYETASMPVVVLSTSGANEGPKHTTRSGHRDRNSSPAVSRGPYSNDLVLCAGLFLVIVSRRSVIVVERDGRVIERHEVVGWLEGVRLTRKLRSRHK